MFGVIGSANAYTITYKCGSGSGTPPESQSVNKNGTITTRANTCTPPSGKIFVSWLISGTSTTVKENTSLKYTYTANKTFTAQYGYSVTYSCGDGSGTAPGDTGAVSNANFMPATNSCTVPSGYTFVGWLVSGTSDVKRAGIGFNWTYTENKTLVAKYKLTNSVELTWHDGDTAISGTSYCTLGGTFSVPAAPASRPGYVFAGWKVKQIYTTCGIENLATGTNGTKYGYCQIGSSGGSNQATYGLTYKQGQWATEFSYGVVYGKSLCSSTSGDNSTNTWPASSQANWIKTNPSSNTSSSIVYCYCQITGFTASGNNYASVQCSVNPAGTKWVLSNGDSYASCVQSCPNNCANNLKTKSAFRVGMFGIVGQ